MPTLHLSPLLFSLYVNNACNASYLLCFADNMKIYMRINDKDDYYNLRSDIYCFVRYFNQIGLSLNINKYKIMIFTRKSSSNVHSYYLMGSILVCADSYVINLSFKFNQSLESNSHIDMICCKALKTLDFVMRLTNEFSLNNTVKALYCALQGRIQRCGGPGTYNRQKLL